MTVATVGTDIGPQPGPQTQGLMTEADILIMGGGKLRSVFFWPIIAYNAPSEA